MRKRSSFTGSRGRPQSLTHFLAGGARKVAENVWLATIAKRRLLNTSVTKESDAKVLSSCTTTIERPSVADSLMKLPESISPVL